MTRPEQLERLRERIFRFAASRIAADRAEDLAQEVLLVLEEKYAHLDRLEDLLPLSLQIMRFKMTASLRKSHRRGENTSVSEFGYRRGREEGQGDEGRGQGEEQPDGRGLRHPERAGEADGGKNQAPGAAAREEAGAEAEG